MAFSNRVLTTTQTELWDKVQDTFLNSNVLATRLMSAPKKWSGRQIEKPVKVTGNSSFTIFSGMQTLPNAPVDTRQKMVWDPTFAAIPVSLPLTEIAVNDTTARVIDLMAVELESSVQDAADAMGTQLYGNGLGDGSNFAGLGYLIDDGTVSATIGGLSRTTYPTLSSTVTALSGGVLSLANIATGFDAPTSGSIRPTLIPTTKAVASLYEKLLTPQDRINKTVTFTKDKRHGGAGYQTADFRGVAIVADEKCTSGQFIFLNEDVINWYALTMPMAKSMSVKGPDIEGNDYGNVSDMGFSWSDWIKPTNAAGVVSQIYVAGQFIAENPKRCAKLTGATTT